MSAPTKKQLDSLRWVGGGTPGHAGSVEIGALKALLDDYDARGNALREAAYALSDGPCICEAGERANEICTEALVDSDKELP